MDLRDAISFLRRLASAEHGPPYPEEPSAPTGEPGATDAGPAGADEFAELLSEVGAEAPTDDGGAFSLKDVEIDELRRNLEALQPMGNRLAETEQERAISASRLRTLERDAAALLAELTSAEVMRTEVERLRRELDDARAGRLAERDEATRVVAGLRDELLSHAREAEEHAATQRELRASRAAVRRLEKSLATARRKHQERHRVATERWHELRKVRAERRAALKRLAALEARGKG